MSGLTLSLLAPLGAPVDASALLAPGWEVLDAAALGARLLVSADRGPLPARALFAITGEPGSTIRLSGDCAMLDDLGQGLAGGSVIVDGNVGARCGGAAPGAKRGMTGGEIVVLGHAGPGAGAAMRRGLLAIAGDCAADAGVGMLAGTIVCGGRFGPGAGRWNKRGTLLALGPVDPPATYVAACTYQPAIANVILARLAVLGFPVPAQAAGGAWRRYSGDLAEYGKGEILQWTATP